ncbi:glutaryl-CoA dehydrogenase [Sinomonas cyclohexanicum]|uniref:Glutaryl-CoA dehydrogenase n=1 Tax=Sinomonas cyclohexanicum TaxID=322009 RepID=A0ABM7PRT6_SINCY|nr:acyl-CoA dehydrogenase family protein [Corynebacterium cyclohexanicum]BCT74790.1 glutaryl-CoA dehydrogenase [Corynebacterium cyclohexanicum]
MTPERHDFTPKSTVGELPAADYYDVERRLDARERAKLGELREFLAAEVAPYAVGWWEREEFPHTVLPKLAALGLSTPRRHGYSRLFTGLVIAELTRVDTSIATFFMVHHDLFVEGLYEFGTPEQRSRYLGDAASLRTTGAFALTEPEHGSDVAGGLSLAARRDGDSWVLDGAKRWIGNGTFADHLLVWAREVGSSGPVTHDGEGPGAVRAFIVAGDSPGLTRTRIEHKTALRTVQNADLVFDGVRVAEADRFASVSSFDDARTMLLGSRLLVSWQAVGQQLAAFDVARAYALEREQFGRPLARFQMVQSQLVQMLGNATASMAMLAELAALQESGQATMARVALAKAWVTARMRETVALGRGVLGGNGILADFGMAKVFADAEAIYTYEGTYEVNALIAGRDITGVSAIA